MMVADNVRFKKYIHNLQKGMSHYQAAIKAGYSKAYAAQITTKTTLEKCPKRSMKIIESLEKRGITNDLIARKIKEGLDANEVKVATHLGRIKDIKKFTDYRTRHTYIDTVIKLKGDYAPEKHEVNDRTGYETEENNDLDKKISEYKKALRE